MSKIKFKDYPENNEIVSSYLSVAYNQDVASKGQELSIHTEFFDTEKESYTLVTDGWTFDSKEEIIEVLEDFLSKLT